MDTSKIELIDICTSAAYITNPDAEVNIVTFAGLRKSGGYGIPAYEFIKTLSSFNANVLFLRDATTRWYNFGLEGFSNNYEDTAKNIEQVIHSKFGSKPLVCIGNSMGGFATLLFGEFLKANLAIAVCPQTFIGKQERKNAGDGRWAEKLDTFDPTVPNLGAILQGGCAKSLVIIGDRNPHDLLHAGAVACSPNVQVQLEKGANHDVNARWKDNGVLMSNYHDLIFSNIA